MKKQFLTLVSIIALIASCKKQLTPFNPTNHLAKFSKVTPQLYHLDTLKYFKIIGKDGTEIYFSREDFDIKSGEKIIAELKEFYSFKELVYNNINTVTNKNELLESSGVIYINFKVNGKDIQLKKGRLLQIRFPNNALKGNNVYLGEIEENQQFKWIEEEQEYTLFSINEGTSWQPLFVERIIHKDSVANYLKKLDEKKKEMLRIDLFKNSTAFFKGLGWINCDRIVNEDYLLSFELDSNLNKINTYACYIVYENLNSFIKEARSAKNLKFTNIKGKSDMYLVILGVNGDLFYSQKIKLQESHNNIKIKLDLKKTNLEQFEELLLN